MTSTGNKLPTFDRLMVPLIRALQALGGSGSIEEIYDKVVELERFPDDVLSQMHDPDKTHETKVAYRLAWARTYLKKYGLLENSTRGIWSLTSKTNEIGELDPRAVVQFVRGIARKDKESNSTGTVDGADAAEPEEEADWKHKLHAVLTQN
jgi:restriction system protein